MTIPRIPTVLTCLAGATLIMALAIADEGSKAKEKLPDSKSPGRETVIQALRPLAVLIGEWKGVGQPKRGSNAGAWSEKAAAAWRFDQDQADLVMTFESGLLFHAAAFSVAEDGITPSLTLERLKGDPLRLTRTETVRGENSPDAVWVFESAADQLPRTRCTVRIISEIRITMLFEEKPAEKSTYRRFSEIGFTRAGARLASGNAGERLCIVTGGLGTIKVNFEGKSYYVCCEGCKQAFDADPAGTIEAWRQRLKDEEKAK